MKIAFVYNLRTKDSEDEAELLTPEIIDNVMRALTELGHKVVQVEASSKTSDFVDRLLHAEPELIFNAAEGRIGTAREAFYPGLYEQLGIPFTGAGPSLLHMNLDKHLAKTVVSAQGINVPRGVLITRRQQPIPPDLRYPLMIKPNAEGSSKGITQNSVAETSEIARARIDTLLQLYPQGVVVEEFIEGRELSVPILEAYPGKLLEIVEHTFNLETIGGKYNIYDYDMKSSAEVAAKAVNIVCPPELRPDEREAILDMARRVFRVMDCPDLGRVDIRLRQDGTPFFIELNPLPSLHPVASMIVGARACGLSYKDIIRLVVRSAARRYGIALRAPQKPQIKPDEPSPSRATARELGIFVGRLRPGLHNAITDVKGVRVGHVTHIEDTELPGVAGKFSVRTGVTAVLPADGNVYTRNVMAGGYVFNGIGEVAGLTQVLEWGWIETPILLTSALAVGAVQSGVVSYMLDRLPANGEEQPTVIPLVGVVDDSYLSDPRPRKLTPADARRAIEAAKAGPVRQGSVGAGTGLTSFGFAGGLGTASRVLADDDDGYTVGVLVVANIGVLPNLTIDGAVVGPHLASAEQRSTIGLKDGSVSVVIATDAPLLPSQLNRLAKRAALGLARVGSQAASTSCEVLLAFSTGNRLAREEHAKTKLRTVRYLGNPHVNPLYQAVIEATEEATLNCMFCSSGMRGRNGRACAALPHEAVVELIGKAPSEEPIRRRRRAKR